jgi:hypothetical protein
LGQGPRSGKTVVIPEAHSLHLDHRLHDEAARPRVGNAERAQRSQCQRLHKFALAPGRGRRQRPDRAFDQKTE